MASAPSQAVGGGARLSEGLLGSSAELPAALLHSGLQELVTDAMAEMFDGGDFVRTLLPVCRSWFSFVVCHPGAFRCPLQAWGTRACRQLDEHLGRTREPPQHWAGDLRIALEHAESELRLTKLAAAHPTGITVVLLRHARWLCSLLIWLRLPARMDPEDGAAPGAAGAAPQDAGGSAGRGEGAADAPSLGSAKAALDLVASAADRRRYRAREAEEFARRLAILSGVVTEIAQRLPDPGLPGRWADWFEDRGELAGLPKSHCVRYREQREQVASVWTNNRVTLQRTAEHVEALAVCCATELGLPAAAAAQGGAASGAWL